jgi:PEGA domain
MMRNMRLMRWMRRMRSLGLLVVALGSFTACATMKPEPVGTLQVECNVPDAAVVLDDAVVGRASDLAKTGKSLRPGFYRVELRHPGHYAHFAEVTVPEGGAVVVKAELHPQLD